MELPNQFRYGIVTGFPWILTTLNWFSCYSDGFTSQSLGCLTSSCYLWWLKYPGRVMSFGLRAVLEPFWANSLVSHWADTKTMIFYGTVSHPCTANLFLTELTNQTKKSNLLEEQTSLKTILFFIKFPEALPCLLSDLNLLSLVLLFPTSLLWLNDLHTWLKSQFYFSNTYMCSLMPSSVA